MKPHPNSDHPLHAYFAQTLDRVLVREVGATDSDVHGYLTGLLVAFMHHDRLYGLRDAEGRRLETVTDMLAEGDVRLNATSFEREREVHRHVGDFLLFWSGMFPEFLRHLRAPDGRDALIDPVRQGQESYYVVSTFDHDPYGDEAKTFRKLSDGFQAYQYALGTVRANFEGLKAGPWSLGFGC